MTFLSTIHLTCNPGPTQKYTLKLIKLLNTFPVVSAKVEILKIFIPLKKLYNIDQWINRKFLQFLTNKDNFLGWIFLLAF